MDEDLNNKVDIATKQVLVKAQKDVGANAIEKTDPERWLQIAGWILDPYVTVRDIRFKHKVQHSVYSRIKAQLMVNPDICDLKEELQVRSVESLNKQADLRETLDEKFRQKLDSMSEEDIARTPLKDFGALSRDMTVASKVEADLLLKLRGENVQRIEVTNKPSDEQIADAISKLRAEIAAKKADVIDVEEV